ncbi:molybdate ABC transporter substrate-binding protein [Nocardioides sp. AX2bis]|uniref:molybdate ABC transporter substrate-binding protein n=1 Tax=Nocardioides sp. AX2bis TaxID=2653157 RepID=UPI0012F404F0|nr:molybdate ABC transporter substrate-binding protein [Nocardioides sp. AX2bis]VXB88530.1 Molybdate-binding protein ModA [Nocardioides sp. AX2bis]
MKKTSALAVTALVALAAAACGSGGDESDAGADGGTTTITVFAAASLTSTFEELATDFEAENDGVEIQFNFAGSSDLVAQLQEGAPADVLATADEANMDKATADDLVGTPTLFASNTLEIAVPPGNPAGITSVDDLTADGLNLVLCAPEVPCGAAAEAVAEAADLDLSPVSEEQSVTDVLAKVGTGEADAGLVYVTDVIAAGDDVEGVEVPDDVNAVNLYPVATVAESEEADLAQAFVDLILAPTGQDALADAGFAPAP